MAYPGPGARTFVAAVFLALLAGAGSADEALPQQEHLTLDQALAEARNQSPTLAQAWHQARASLASSELARAIEQREWRLAGGVGETAEQNAAPTFWFAHFTVWNELRVLVADGGRAKADRILALAEAVIAEAEYERVAADLEYAVTSAYYAAISTDGSLAVSRDGASLVGDHLRMAQARFEAGDASELDVFRARAEMATVEAEVAQAGAERSQARRELVRLMGRDVEIEADILLEAPAVAEVEDRPDAGAVGEHAPEVLVARAELSAAEAGIDVARKQSKPDLEFAVGHTFDTDVTDSRHILHAGLEWNLPIGDHGASDDRKNEADALRLAAGARLADVQSIAQTDLLNAVDVAQAALVSLTTAQAAASYAGTVHEKASIGYEEGAVSMRDLLDARFDLTQAELARLKAECARAVTLAAIRRLLSPTAAPLNPPITP